MVTPLYEKALKSKALGRLSLLNTVAVLSEKIADDRATDVPSGALDCTSEFGETIRKRSVVPLVVDTLLDTVAVTTVLGSVMTVIGVLLLILMTISLIGGLRLG